ncbi:adenylate/guanylate cyclase domain-containing protein [Labilibaculum manganireducens]|uniref:adenylate/guanylate cyclase domain-containing protein n=1 Tax=Labilibaculum manganireducens TaxID=1940525 RepID=UPI0015D6570B|nr:adenylate/guanylate cyclase domain-containing protein [Labilibaculum manganireducens]
MSISLGLFHYSIEKGLGFIDSVKQINDFIFNPIGLYFFIIGLFIKYTLDVFLGALKRTGLSLFFNSLFGKYKKPFEENRIFIFLDLVSSTNYSEKLGHENYSAFLQECFLTISSSIVNNRGIIYQFVGDEVVITWKGNKKENYKRAINFYFQFIDDLNKKEKLFLKKYGIHPEFTASLNSGNVMVAEVGDIKTEIAYHGSVLNTASRLQKQCKKYGARLLATEAFVSNLRKTQHDYTYEFLDLVHLSGKVNSEKIFHIKREDLNDTISN